MRQLFWLLLVICSIVPKVSGLQCKNPSLVSIRSNRKYVKSGEGKNDFPLRKFEKGLTRHTMSSKNEDENNNKDASSESLSSSLSMLGGGDTLAGAKKNQNTGRLLLIFVAFLYGSLNVVFRLVYAAPDPPSASALSFTRGWLAAASFLPILAANRNNSDDEVAIEEDTDKKAPLWKAAFELAFWNFGAQGLLNIGLLFTDAARASFLTQSSVVITPIISIFAGQKVPQIVWAGCLSALAGLIMLSGGGDGGSGLTLAFSTGDLLVLGGALSWSMYLFRIATVGKRYPEIPLQSLKTTLLAALYSVWFLSSALTLLVKGSSIATLWPGWTNLGVWMLLVYSAVGPGAIADVLQQIGQKEVSASEANVILSSEPIFTAICARLVLGEITSTTENIGGALIVIGALLASIA